MKAPLIANYMVYEYTLHSLLLNMLRKEKNKVRLFLAFKGT